MRAILFFFLMVYMLSGETGQDDREHEMKAFPGPSTYFSHGSVRCGEYFMYYPDDSSRSRKISFHKSVLFFHYRIQTSSGTITDFTFSRHIFIFVLDGKKQIPTAKMVFAKGKLEKVIIRMPRYELSVIHTCPTH